MKKQKYTSEWTQANPRVSCTLGQSVLGSLCVSRARLFLNFVAPNSDSAFGLGVEGLVPYRICCGSVTVFVPLGPSSACRVSFHEPWDCSLVNSSSILDRAGFNQSLFLTSVTTEGISFYELFSLCACAEVAALIRPSS